MHTSKARRSRLLRRSGLLRRGLAALAASFLLLCRRTALLRARRARRGTRLLPAAARGPGGVGDLRGALLGHPLVLQRFVLLLVLDVRALARHLGPPSRTTDRLMRPRAEQCVCALRQRPQTGENARSNSERDHSLAAWRPRNGKTCVSTHATIRRSRTGGARRWVTCAATRSSPKKAGPGRPTGRCRSCLPPARLDRRSGSLRSRRRRRPRTACTTTSSVRRRSCSRWVRR